MLLHHILVTTKKRKRPALMSICSSDSPPLCVLLMLINIIPKITNIDLKMKKFDSYWSAVKFFQESNEILCMHSVRTNM